MCFNARLKNGFAKKTKTAGSSDPAATQNSTWLSLRHATQLSPRPIQKIRLAGFLDRRRRRADLLLNGALQLEGARRQIVGLGLDQEGVEAAIVVDALDRIGRNAQAHVARQRFRDERHVDEVRQEAALGLDVGVADLVADEGALGREFAAARHVTNPSV